MNFKRVAIIGAGPAGIMCAHMITQANMPVSVFDHRIPWEKPCGGMIPSRAYKEFLDMKNYNAKHTWFSGITWISPGNEKNNYKFDEEFFVTSRLNFSEYLLKSKISTKCNLVKEKVISINCINNVWEIITENGIYYSDIIVGADGVNSIVRKLNTDMIPDEHLSFSCGYIFEPSNDYIIIMKSLDIEGYSWVINADGFSRAGILARYKSLTPSELYQKLDLVINSYYPNAKIVGKYAALVPSARDESFFLEPCAGENWLLIGDAAGHADPILCEGIYYAFKSGELAAKAIISGEIQSYENNWRKSYGQELINSVKAKKTMLQMAKDFGPSGYGTMLFFYCSNLSKNKA